MASEEIIFTLVYLLFVMCLAYPPVEVRSAGLTIENLLHSWLGSEGLHFVHYHIKRTAATTLIHSALPLGYYISFGIISPRSQLFQPWAISLAWMVFLCLSIGILALAIAQYIYWYKTKWNTHPIPKSLSYHGNSWHAVASSINLEFRRVDKFQTGPPGARTYVTDTWIIKTSIYKVCFAHQQDCHLNILGTEEHTLSPESPAGLQIVNIDVISLNRNIPSFTIRLNAVDYRDLKDKVSSPLLNARNVVIQQSLTDRFLVTFREQVERNVNYKLPGGSSEPDNCIGCFQVQSNIKLVKLCDESTQGDCVQCFCRPMWCFECMCKWFVSRQEQNRPETWLSGKSPCPTCRSKFCLLDVCLIEPS